MDKVSGRLPSGRAGRQSRSRKASPPVSAQSVGVPDACPFCGEHVTIKPGDKIFTFRCPDHSPCVGSGLGTFGQNDRQEDAIAAWNRRASDWQPIETAPYRKNVEVRVGEGMTFLAMLVPDASMTDEEQSCDQWTATHEGEHPPCWSGGGCWASNEDEVESLQPTAWRYPAQAHAPTTHDHSPTTDKQED